jgi:lipoate-protein ligase A
MRARLLDLGEVGPVRSQSAYHAVLATRGEGADPVLVLARPVAPLVSIGDAGAGVVDLEAAEAAGLPLVARRIGGPAAILGAGDLLIQLVMPTATAPAAAVRTAAEPVVAMLAALGVAARAAADGSLATARGRLGSVQVAVLESALCLVYNLTWKVPSALPAGLAGGSTTSVAAESEDPPNLADLAERLLSAVEDHFGLELIPSLPTPAELEAIYEWDERLLLAAGEARARTSSATVLQ